GVAAPYAGGKLSVAKAMIGVGYTKRSLAVAFEGSVTLPPRAIDDLDTTRRLGVGVRLPPQVSLYFRFDLIPVPYIKVLPYFEFKLDLRGNVSRGITSTRTCEPFWDGLEFHLPNVYEYAFKHYSFSPMFGPFIIPNFNWSDVNVVGTKANGATLVVDNFLYMIGLIGPGGLAEEPFMAC